MRDAKSGPERGVPVAHVPAAPPESETARDALCPHARSTTSTTSGLVRIIKSTSARSVTPIPEKQIAGRQKRQRATDQWAGRAPITNRKSPHSAVSVRATQLRLSSQGCGLEFSRISRDSGVKSARFVRFTSDSFEPEIFVVVSTARPKIAKLHDGSAAA